MSRTFSKSKSPAAEWVPIEKLRLWSKNPDPPQEGDIASIAKSIERFGFGEPLLARRANGEIIAGHGRWMAAMRLGLTELPVRWMDLDENEAHVLALADNKIAANRERHWEGEQMKVLLGELREEGADLLLGTGFDAEALDALFLEEAEPLLDSTSPDVSPKLGEIEYRVLVECRGEGHQAELLERLEKEGLVCRPLMS